MSLLGKMHKVLKKHYKPVPIPDRPVLEHLLFACCLENGPYDAAERAFAAISTTFFDFNEVRVSTVKELSEVMHMLPEPAVAAANLKRVLQSVFESTYSFDLEPLKKQNLGQAAQRLKKIDGTTPFAIAYVTQATLGGHAIPVDRGLLGALAVLRLVTEDDMAAGVVPGLERAIPKNKGVEFGSLAHQLGADFLANPYSPGLHKILLEITSDAKDRLPKRPSKAARTSQDQSTAPSPARPAEAELDAKSRSAAAKKKAELPRKPPAGKKTDGEAAPTAEKKAAGKKPPEKKKSAVAGLSKKKPR
jgi:hypothetical protein